jgi:hypothetical protein
LDARSTRFFDNKKLFECEQNQWIQSWIIHQRVWFPLSNAGNGNANARQAARRKRIVAVKENIVKRLASLCRPSHD